MYCGVIALRGRSMLQDEAALAERLSYEVKVNELKRIAADGLDMFHVRLLRPNEHSLGSHDPPVPEVRSRYPRSCCTTSAVSSLQNF
jgi:hypothetical protein